MVCAIPPLLTTGPQEGGTPLFGLNRYVHRVRFAGSWGLNITWVPETYGAKDLLTLTANTEAPACEEKTSDNQGTLNGVYNFTI